VVCNEADYQICSLSEKLFDLATATVDFYVGGIKLLPYSIQVEQRSDWHHRFEVIVSTEKAKVLGGGGHASITDIIENAIAYAGELAEIIIKRSNGTFNFKGYVTDVNLDQTYAGDAFILFKGFSPTYLLEGQKSVASFEEMSLSDVFNETLSNFPANIQKEVSPQYGSAIPYVVRYKETQYQFLSRLAAIYGEWFYYDGQKIVFGELPSNSPTVKLTFGSDSMLSFNYGINLRPSGFKQNFYKYEDNGLVEQDVSSFKPGWLDGHSKISLDTSNELFSEEALDPVTHQVANSNHLKHIAEAKKSSILSDVMLFNGQSANPAITVGAEVEVNSRSGFIGKYRVIAVSHSFSSNRDYYNIFRAIPATTLAPPSNRGVVMPEAESQIGVVTDNNDPDKLGRVRVETKWGSLTPWLRVMNNYAGKGGAEGVTGTYFTPEIGDEVRLEFEQGNPDRPYVSGSHYHGSIAPDFADADNNLKAIKTRSGHKLIFDDKDGEERILITDKKGNMMEIETSGEHITINAGERITIKAGTGIVLDAGQTIALKSGGSISLSSGVISLTAGASVNVSAVSAYNLNTNNKMEIVSANTMLKTKNLTTTVNETSSITAKKISNTAKESITSSSKDKILFSAKNKLEQRGGKMDLITQKGKLRLKAKSNAEIKGKQVKNN